MYVENFEKAGVIPVFYHDDIEICLQVLKATYEGGCRVFEFTNRGGSAKKNFKELRRVSSESMKDMHLVIGSILDANTAEAYIELGADAIISPILDTETAMVCKKHNIMWVPGCATLTEMVQAQKLGASLIKLFPANIYGPAFVSSVLAPIPGLKIMPTGGVEPVFDNLKAWFSSGVVCVGMGGKLFPKETLAKKEFHKVKDAMRYALDLVLDVKKSI